MNNSNQQGNSVAWVVLGILLLFLAFGLLPFVPEIRLFNILWMIFFSLAGIGAICYALILQPKLQRANWKKREIVEAALAYEIAYRVVPDCIFGEVAQDEDRLNGVLSDHELGDFLYCTHIHFVVGAEPSYEVRSEYKTRHGKFDAETPYVLLQFPKRKLPCAECFLLAPFFSCIIRPESTKRIEYYVLGERPQIPGDIRKRAQTTFRSVSRDGVNANLGPGPLPTASAFLEHIVKFRENMSC